MQETILSIFRSIMELSPEKLNAAVPRVLNSMILICVIGFASKGGLKYVETEVVAIDEIVSSCSIEQDSSKCTDEQRRRLEGAVVDFLKWHSFTLPAGLLAFATVFAVMSLFIATKIARKPQFQRQSRGDKRVCARLGSALRKVSVVVMFISGLFAVAAIAVLLSAFVWLCLLRNYMHPILVLPEILPGVAASVSLIVIGVLAYFFDVKGHPREKKNLILRVNRNRRKK